MVLHDSGGTANGGSDASAPQVFTIFVNGDTDGDGIHDAWTRRGFSPILPAI